MTLAYYSLPESTTSAAGGTEMFDASTTEIPSTSHDGMSQFSPLQEKIIFKLHKVANQLNEMNIYAHKSFDKFDDKFTELLLETVDHCEEVMQSLIAHYEHKFCDTLCSCCS